MRIFKWKRIWKTSSLADWMQYKTICTQVYCPKDSRIILLRLISIVEEMNRLPVAYTTTVRSYWITTPFLPTQSLFSYPKGCGCVCVGKREKWEKQRHREKEIDHPKTSSIWDLRASISSFSFVCPALRLKFQYELEGKAFTDPPILDFPLMSHFSEFQSHGLSSSKLLYSLRNFP